MSVASEMDAQRIALAEVDVLAALTRTAFGDADWGDADPAVVEAIATLLGLIDKSSFSAMSAFHRLHRAIAAAQPAPAGEQRDHEAPGGRVAMSAQDAEIVRRIRERCPDVRPRCAGEGRVREPTWDHRCRRDRLVVTTVDRFSCRRSMMDICSAAIDVGSGGGAVAELSSTPSPRSRLPNRTCTLPRIRLSTS